MNTTVFRLLAPIAIFLSGTALAADPPVWKGVDKNGQTVYSNSPAGLTNPKKTDLPPPSIQWQGAVSTDSAPPPLEPHPSAPPPPAPVSPDDVAKARFEKIKSELASAREDAKKGEEPKNDERQRTVSGSRLVDSYFERQAALKKRIEALERELEIASKNMLEGR